MDRLETKRRLLIERIRAAASIIVSDGDVTYVICARTHDEESGKVLTGILTNLGYRDTAGGELYPPTLSMMSDVLSEAVLDDPNVGMKQNVDRAVDQYKH